MRRILMNNRKKLLKLALCAVIAALYAAITILTAPLSFGLVQFRLSEALMVARATLLPAYCTFMPAFRASRLIVSRDSAA